MLHRARQRDTERQRSEQDRFIVASAIARSPKALKSWSDRQAAGAGQTRAQYAASKAKLRTLAPDVFLQRTA